MASLFGSKSVFFLSQDDKARVPLGLAAAKKQSPILMHLQYRVQLPDHDWVVAERHKLTPSVYAGLDLSKGTVSYSGPTYIAVRSGKHDSSTASTHAFDFEKLVNLQVKMMMAGKKRHTAVCQKSPNPLQCSPNFNFSLSCIQELNHSDEEDFEQSTEQFANSLELPMPVFNDGNIFDRFRAVYEPAADSKID